MPCPMPLSPKEEGLTWLARLRDSCLLRGGGSCPQGLFLGWGKDEEKEIMYLLYLGKVTGGQHLMK